MPIEDRDVVAPLVALSAFDLLVKSLLKNGSI